MTVSLSERLLWSLARATRGLVNALPNALVLLPFIVIAPELLGLPF